MKQKYVAFAEKDYCLLAAVTTSMRMLLKSKEKLRVLTNQDGDEITSSAMNGGNGPALVTEIVAEMDESRVKLFLGNLGVRGFGYAPDSDDSTEEYNILSWDKVPQKPGNNVVWRKDAQDEIQNTCAITYSHESRELSVFFPTPLVGAALDKNTESELSDKGIVFDKEKNITLSSDGFTEYLAISSRASTSGEKSLVDIPLVYCSTEKKFAWF